MIDRSQFELPTSFLQGITHNKLQSFFTRPPYRVSFFFSFSLFLIVYVRVICVFLRFDFDSVSAQLFFCLSFVFFFFFAPEIVKLYKKLVSIVFIDRASYGPTNG